MCVCVCVCGVGWVNGWGGGWVCGGHLVDEDLGEDGARARARDSAVQPAVEKVARGAVNQEAEAGQAEEPGPVNILLLDEDLRQEVADGEAGERRERLHQERLALQRRLVLLPEDLERVVGRVARLGTIDVAAASDATPIAADAAGRAARCAVLDVEAPACAPHSLADKIAAEHHLWPH